MLPRHRHLHPLSLSLCLLRGFIQLIGQRRGRRRDQWGCSGDNEKEKGDGEPSDRDKICHRGAHPDGQAEACSDRGQTQ